MLHTRGRKTRPPLPLIAAGIWAVVTALFLADPAKADPDQDYTFYAALAQQDIEVANPPAARLLGIQTCNELRSGTSWRITATKLMNQGLTLPQSLAVLNAAVAAYCPDRMPAEGRSA